jgi:hypothetical protein
MKMVVIANASRARMTIAPTAVIQNAQTKPVKGVLNRLATVTLLLPLQRE